jgi:SAM-dependent methyltransferase
VAIEQGSTGPSGSATLPLTGERTMPGVPSENYWFRRHEAAYRHLLGDVPSGLLVEIGPGEGYGAALLAERADHVIAIDYDAASAAHLALTYPQLAAVQGNLAAVPIRSQAASAVACLQVIEHVWDHPQFISECARVLAPGGLLMLSTPNRLTFSPGLDSPVNPFHTHEFTAWELSGLVAHNSLAVMAVRGLFAGERLRQWDQQYAEAGQISFVAAQLARPPQDWPAELRTRVEAVTAADFEIRDTATDDCLDLILLARRP